MNRLRVALVFAVMLAFFAGTVLGIGRGRVASKKTESSLSKELGLSADQEQKIRGIWSDMLEGGPRESQRRGELAAERDAQIAGMLTAEQQAKYQKIQDDYRAQIRDVEMQRDAAFAAADEKTRAVLTPEQAKRFDQVIHPDGPRRGPPGFMDEHRTGEHHGPPGPPPGF